ncbi:8779_t:CDS:2 [Funneliformis geosporum]|nr:8779_t:CDS:2 [Funneliformis geosporum]
MSSNESLDVFTSTINNGEMFITHHPINVRRRQNRQQNTDGTDGTLNRILTLPIQSTNDQLINEFFNGTSFS